MLFSDGIVDAQDLIILAEHMANNPEDVNEVNAPWLIENECKGLAVRKSCQLYYFYDVGPTPSGDGIVDVQDLIVIAEHLFEEILPAQ